MSDKNDMRMSKALIACGSASARVGPATDRYRTSMTEAGELIARTTLILRNAKKLGMKEETALSLLEEQVKAYERWATTLTTAAAQVESNFAPLRTLLQEIEHDEK